ncbi:uncharacterized protein [Oryza sativa Japonica Group]|uniref:Os07g0258000 protein n=3 Tax=Oryza TaxID=4527 RepID=Q7F103_ORYSJ|nr:uncharacterized protein LOC4342860 [Oryza sativa Japonica Group]KAB8104966.1 hypothetical protein EE612_038297 [Oryza sativa]KAF2922186.1 hypothetical protein DAI22_07g093400 [Oryza sativa Japonica Group]BAC83305.1 unknown protein [Oryza sativa Japonica Group]BAD30210.1 hypothetical protein [Oryza sativa Japonica Group]BAF21227.1 Os07g0258000 [Oryza sativa Japonica Group]|eukprot:NP_001059313.1 Os07g0258000 [Oryza sativa Japonica Group]
MSSSLIPPPLADSDGASPPPHWVLIDIWCYIGDLPNATTAESTTSTGLPIKVTFRTARPPLLSHLCVHCPGLDFLRATPKVIASHADLLLLVVPFDPLTALSSGTWDYFVYRAADPPLLHLIPPPPRSMRFNDSEVAIVSHGDGEYAVAALAFAGTFLSVNKDFHLHLYHGGKQQQGEWVSKLLTLEDQLRDKLVPLPKAAAEYRFYQETRKTIVIGGERGTVGWVDLWRGIIFCDVLDDHPVLRDMPLPLPASGNWDRLLKQTDPNYIRDVTVSLCRDSIKYIELEIVGTGETHTTVQPTESYQEWVRRKPRYTSSVVLRRGWKATI